MSGIKPLGLVIPTRWEVGEILRRFPFQKTSSNFYKATIDERTVYLCISGVGRSAARVAAARLVKEGARELVSAGFCGALTPDLHVGDLVTHRMATVDKPARNEAERRAITERANAVAVDMETQAVIEEGTRRGVPIQVLRVVSDEFKDDLTWLFGSDGNFAAWRMAIKLMNPAVWSRAAQLRRQSKTASARLADALEKLLSTGRQSGLPGEIGD
jgi:nucleoside phosphorylase